MTRRARAAGARVRTGLALPYGVAVRDLGTTVITVGGVIVVVGLAMRAGLLGWVGRLPGDLRLGSGSTRVFIPITTSIIASVVLSLVLAALRR